VERVQQVAEVVGLDHVYLTVSDLARAERFYDAVLQLLGFRKGDKAIAGAPHAHYVNRVMQVTLRPAERVVAHDPCAPGLHHLCLQVASHTDVDAVAAGLGMRGVEATAPRRYPEYNPDYYATFFSDPDGLRLEVVARTPYRDALVRYWDAFAVFLNPLAELQSRAAAGSPPEIRELDRLRDQAGVRQCFVELQDHERSVDPHLPRGDAIADVYLARMYARCREFDGGVMVAGEAGAVVGFVTVWTRFRSDEPDDDPTPHAFVSDLVVAASHRGRGIGRALLRAAVARAHAAGAPCIRLSVQAGNIPAASLYASEGFRAAESFLERRLGPASA
jgi:ribosomal protein S18 acetylase RimI-like enzyme